MADPKNPHPKQRGFDQKSGGKSVSKKTGMCSCKDRARGGRNTDHGKNKKGSSTTKGLQPKHQLTELPENNHLLHQQEGRKQHRKWAERTCAVRKEGGPEGAMSLEGVRLQKKASGPEKRVKGWKTHFKPRPGGP